MYFIQEGIVDIVMHNGEVATSLSDGSYFGGKLLPLKFVLHFEPWILWLRSHTLIQSVGEVFISIKGSSPHGMMNASALETVPRFHSMCGA